MKHQAFPTANSSVSPLLTPMENKTLTWIYWKEVNILYFYIPHYPRGKYFNDLVLHMV